MVFPDRPDCLLFFVPDGGRLEIPALTSPFYKGTTATALGQAGVEYRITESVPGRWTDSMMLMRKSEKAERAQMQKQREATLAVFDRGGGDLGKTRAGCITRKHDVDGQIRDTKAWLGKAKSDAFYHQKYAEPSLYRRKERDLHELQQESLALQARLGELRKTEKKAQSDEYLQMFKDAALRVLTREQFDSIVEAMGDNLADDERVPT